MSAGRTIRTSDVFSLFERAEFDDEVIRYLDYHGKRFAFGLNAIARFKEERPLRKLLDVGPHLFTLCICEFFPDVEVSTLGWKSELLPEHLFREHIDFDLNDADVREIDSREAPFDLITFAETIEHLYTSPAVVLPALKRLLSERGGILIQTPNAAELGSRLRLLTGRHPYELIRVDRTNPGHFREYTLKELVQYAHDAGFDVDSAEHCAYWSIEVPVLKQIVDAVPSFRKGITLLISNR